MPSDESPWAPPDAQGREAAPADVSKDGEGSMWAPPTSGMAGATPRRIDDRFESTGLDGDEVGGVAAGTVVVGPVTADGRASVAARLVAAVVAAVMVAGGALLVFGAGMNEGGAATPEAAFEQALAAVEAGDLVALAEVMTPDERSTILAAGFVFLEDLDRLGLLVDEFDVSATSALDVSVADPATTVSFPRDDLAHVFVDRGTVEFGFDPSAMAAGDWGGAGSSELEGREGARLEITVGARRPIVAVRQDGRWYLSITHTVAEAVRRTVDAPLPDPADEPVPIGAETPEGAVTRFLEELVLLDPARLVGMLDPQESAALYGFSPLFLDDLSVEANRFLESTAADGWSWSLDELEFRVDEDGDLATVHLERLAFTAVGASGEFSVTVDGEQVGASLRLVDEFWDEETSWTLTRRDDCLEIVVIDGAGTETVEPCAAVDGAASVVAAGIDRASAGIVTRRVEGRWYLSPVRTMLDGLVESLESSGEGPSPGLPGAVSEVIDLARGLIADPLGVFDGFDLAAIDAPGTGMTSAASGADLEHGDLLAPGLDLLFAYDLDAAQGAWELEFFVPGLGRVEVVRGVYATVDVVGGEVPLVVVETAVPVEVEETLEAIADGRGAVALTPSVPEGIRFAFVDDFGDPVVVEFDGVTLTLVGVYGASRDAATRVLDTQTGW